MPNERGKRYLELRAQAAERLGLAETDTAVERLALLRLQRESLAVDVIEGRKVDSLELLRLDDAIVAAIPAEPTRQHTVTIKLIPPTDRARVGEGSVSGVKQCRRCGWQPPETDTVAACYKCGWRE